MKKHQPLAIILSLCIILLIPLRSFTQYYVPLDSCNFDSGDCALLNTIDSGSIWEIGIPQKPYLDEAYSFPNSLITDDSLPYPSNRRDFVQLDFATPEFENYYFEFWHKHQMDTLKDGGFVAISRDSSEFYNIAYLEWQPYPVAIQVETEGYTYNANDPGNLFGIDTGYTGSSVDWQFTRVWITFVLGVSPGKMVGWSEVPDSVHVRFYIVSDSINGGEDGWAIDNFLYGSFPISGDIKNLHSEQIKIYPNPVSENIYFFNQNIAGKIFDVKIISMQGNLIKYMEDLHSIDGNGKANISEIPEGNYIIQIITNEAIYFSPFIKQ